MGTKDYRHRETKKTRKDAKEKPLTILTSSETVEVIKKGKKTPSPPEE